MDVNDAADRLYGLRPEEFTAARNEQAAALKKDGDRALAGQISALRRPSLSAWACNLLVREQPDEVAHLVTLGKQLRQAHQDLDGGQLRELSDRQRRLVGALTRQAVQLAAEAGHQLGDSARREIEESLHAVLADSDAARTWAEGRLAKPLSGPTGFPGVAPETTPGRAKTPPAARTAASDRRSSDDAQEHRRQQQERARQEADDAQSTFRARQEEAEAAAGAAEDAAGKTGQAEERATDLADQLKRAQQEQSRARKHERDAKGAARDAEREMREARRLAETAAARLQRLTEDDG
ncbi:hypothetical protein ACFUIV_31420 [Streptomyces anulatus]|uniref:hypothetical protein n=1 Tax=Streptomyces anulatus TaxID=1892 RepID=UPI0036324F1D